MPGTVATYQGFPCHDVRFRRTRGWRADTSSVLLFAADFPAGFEFVVPVPGSLAEAPLVTEASLDLGALDRPPRPAARARRLEYAGALVLAEVDPRGIDYRVTIAPLFCVALEAVKRNDDGSLSVVRAKLVDARYFYGRGVLRRWSFNRSDGEGNPSLDSVRPDGELYSLTDVAQNVASSLFRSPELSHSPARWVDSQPEVEFPPFGSATGALVRLAQDHGAQPLCLNLDNSVALWEPGAGRVGFAPDGKGPGNTASFPAGLRVSLRGTGQSSGMEASYPPDYVVVVGGLRVATVRVDELDPVLVIDDRPVGLTEETVRKLTEGKHGLPWLQAFVLAPQAYQNDVDLDSRVMQLFREQAYRLWRIPDVEREVTDPGEEGSVRVKGPNAHLLPLRARAETSGGKRLPVRVDGYRFASVHRAMAGSRESSQIATIQAQLRELKRQIQERARRLQRPDPWTAGEVYFLFRGDRVNPLLLFAITGAQSHGVSYEQFQGMLTRARLLQRIGEVSPGLAGQYGSRLAELFGVDETLGGSQKALFEIAKEAAAFEAAVSEQRDVLETPNEEARQQAETLRNRVREALRAIDRAQEASRTRTRVGASRAVAAQSATFVRNLPRRVDSGARIYSAELGIVRTSDLCGHVADEGVPVAEATSLVPRSPLVYFGAVLRPRADQSGQRPVTGEPLVRGETLIPAVLRDSGSYYTACFRRLAPGRAQQIALGEVPAGEGVSVQRGDLVELVPLQNESNRAALDTTAREVALGLFSRPERVESAKYSVARPWPVNCDGVVAGVEIAMRPRGKGFVTTIHTGSEAEVLEPLGRTRPRVRRGAPSDAAQREGLQP